MLDIEGVSIGYRSVHFALDGASEDRSAYIAWLIGACKAKDAGVASIIDNAAIALLAERLRTPLQIEQHLTLAFEHGFRCGENPSPPTSSRPSLCDNSTTLSRA